MGAHNLHWYVAGSRPRCTSTQPWYGEVDPLRLLPYIYGYTNDVLIYCGV